MTKHLTEIEPYAVRAREAGRRGGHGRTKTFALVKSGEYDAYLDGGVLMITTESIRRRIHRKLSERKAAVTA
jgi:chloramphenicol 3-O-phosphotransferase